MDYDKLIKIKQELQIQYVSTVDNRKWANHVVPDALSISPVIDPGKEENGMIEFGTSSAITSDIGINNYKSAGQKMKLERILDIKSSTKLSREVLKFSKRDMECGGNPLNIGTSGISNYTGIIFPLKEI